MSANELHKTEQAPQAQETHRATQPSIQPSPSPAGPPPAAPEFTVTAAAVAKLRAFQAENPEFVGKSFRVFIEGGGCSGFNYGFVFDDAQADVDFTFLAEGFPVACDPASMQYLRGATVDFVEDFQASGFVVRNPNAKTSCGCGSSFGV